MDFNTQIASNKIRQVLFLCSILLLGVLLFLQMTFMLSSFLGAITLFMILRKPMYRLVYEKGWKKWSAATILMTTSFLVIVIPFAWVGYILADRISPLFSNPQILTDVAHKIQSYINTRFGMDILSARNLEKATSTISEIVPPLISSTANAFMNIVIAYFLLWFLLINAGDVERWLLKHLPFKPENRSIVLAEVKESVMSNAIGLPIMGVIQGVLAGVGFWIFNVQDPVIWGIVTGICSFIPFVGTMAAWVPIALLAFANGNINDGIGLTVWGLIVIGMSDNVIRIILQKHLGDAHPLLTVFGVIVGLNMFGFLGLIFGPLIISLFLLLVKIYVKEFVPDTE
jgi:predicted PurR-regulated permease PerM